MIRANLFAMAGLAEVGCLIDLTLGWTGLVLIAGVTAAAYLTRRPPIAWTSIALLALFSVYFMPWSVFLPADPEAWDDPDFVKWMFRFRVMGEVWIVVSLAALGTVPIAQQTRQARTALKPSV